MLPFYMCIRFYSLFFLLKIQFRRFVMLISDCWWLIPHPDMDIRQIRVEVLLSQQPPLLRIILSVEPHILDAVLRLLYFNFSHRHSFDHGPEAATSVGVDDNQNGMWRSTFVLEGTLAF